MMKHTTRIIAASAALVLLVGCTSGGKDDNPPSGSNAEESVEAEAADDESEDAGPGELMFGETYTYEDGLSVTIAEDGELEILAADREFYPEYFAEGTTNRKFSVKVVNNTGQPFDPTMVTLSGQSGNTNADQVFYSSGRGSDNSLDAASSLLDGREGVYMVAFNVSDPEDIVLEVSPDMGIEYEPFFYTS